MSVEPVMKKARGENVTLLTAIETCCSHVLGLKEAFNQRFSSLETRVGVILSGYNVILKKIDELQKLVERSLKCENHRHTCCDEILTKISTVEEVVKSLPIVSDVTVSQDLQNSNGEMVQTPVVLVRSNKPAQVSASVGLDSTVQVITLNSESDYPDGSWLGDESNPESRVRCPITPAKLLNINMCCQTPEKMAITLLDYLFSRDTLAVSNLSGKGKHNKKQLDPLMIYGIQCHLRHRFSITEKDWYRIKQNMDSKCRTAWRKKVRGLPLAKSKASQNESHSHQLHQIISEDGDSLIVTAGPYSGEDSVEEMEAQVIHTPQGDIQVLHATPEQLVRLQETHNIQVLSEDLILPILQEHSHILGSEDTEGTSGSSLTLDCDEQTLTIVTSSGEVTMDVADISRAHLVETQNIQTTPAIRIKTERDTTTTSEADSAELLTDCNAE
ncbi:protein BANP isoform X2 [Anabrus simplex]